MDLNGRTESGPVRAIDPGTPPTRFARGWHCLGLGEPYRDGVPHAVRAFGTKLADFADSRGALARCGADR